MAGWEDLSPVALATVPWTGYAALLTSHADWLTGALSVGLAGAGAVLSAAFGLPFINRRMLQPIEETRLWDLLPFDEPVKGGLRLRDGALTAAVRVAGIDLTAAGLEEIEAKRARRRQWFADLDPHLTYRIFQTRRRVAWRQPEGETTTRRARRIVDSWFAQFAESYVLETTIVMEVAGGAQRARERLERAVGQTLSILEPFGAERLIVDGETDPLLAFWGQRINPANVGRLVMGRHRDRRVTRQDAARLGFADQIPDMEKAGVFGSGLPFRLAGGWVETFPDGMIRHSAGGGDDVIAYVVAIPMWGDGTAESLNRDLLRVRGEISVVHRLKPLPSDEAQSMVRKSANNARSNEDDEMAVAQQKAVADERLSPISTNKEGLSQYETWVFCYGRNRSEAQTTTRQVVQIMRDYQIRPRVVDKDDAEHLYFGQFPTYNAPLRNCHFFTSNLSDVMLFENVAAGHTKCDWGEQPVLPLRTQFGTTFGFVPHADESKDSLGHMLVVGRQGSGKTKFLQLLATAASRYPGMRVMWFDRDFASAPWALAVNADYFDFVDAPGGLKSAKLNPLYDLDPTDAADQQALRVWFSLLCEMDDDEAMNGFGRAIANAGMTPLNSRNLATIASVTFGSHTPTSRALQRWIDPKQLGAIWQSQGDGLALDNRINIFNMTSILEDPRLAAPVVAYLWYRHRRAVRAAGGAPSLVVVDETRPLLTSQVMRKELFRELREGRRRSEVVTFVFQEPSAIGAIGDGDVTATLRGSFATQVLFPIVGSKEVDWAHFELTPSERAFLMGLTRPECRYPALIRKPTSGISVIVDLDQESLGEDELFLRGGQNFALAAHEARRVSPADPASDYLTRAHRIDSKVQELGG
jgi:energy-coupling factor transporter ATP-binding protein EcfA2